MREQVRVWIGLGLTTIIFLVGGCNNTNVGPVPNADIVFQTVQKDDGVPYSVGFINSDGTGLEYLEFQDSRGMPAAPVQTSDGEYLVFYGSYYDDFYGRGLLQAITKQGRLVEYEDIFSSWVAPIQNSHQVVAMGTTGGTSQEAQDFFYSFDLDTNTVIEENLHTTEQGVRGEIGTNALYESNLLFTRYSERTGSEVVLLDIDSGEETVVARNTEEDTYHQIFPTISPNGQWVVYTSENGIYIVSASGGEPKQIVNTCAVCEDSPGNSKWDNWPPAASWSPDSQWIVYHRCTLPCLECCEDVRDYAVYKTNIETTEEILLVEGGLNPYWRLSLNQ